MGREQVIYGHRLRGVAQTDPKREAEMSAVGGLRDASKTLSKLHSSSTFGRKLGKALMKAVTENLVQHASVGTRGQSWVEQMCSKIGAAESVQAPEQAVECVRDIIRKHVGTTSSLSGTQVPGCSTSIDAHLLEAWRRAACDPDDAVCQWLVKGAPAGTLHIAFHSFSKLSLLICCCSC